MKLLTIIIIVLFFSSCGVIKQNRCIKKYNKLQVKCRDYIEIAKDTIFFTDTITTEVFHLDSSFAKNDFLYKLNNNIPILLEDENFNINITSSDGSINVLSKTKEKQAILRKKIVVPRPILSKKINSKKTNRLRKKIEKLRSKLKNYRKFSVIFGLLIFIFLFFKVKKLVGI